MECAGKVEIKVPTVKQEITLYNLSDIHLGNKACAKKKLMDTIAEIEDNPFARWFATGDLGEYISNRDKRHDFSVLDDKIFDTPAKMGNMGKTLTEALITLFTPIKDKCLGIGVGNHEWSYEVANNQEGLHRVLCYELNARYLGYTAFLDTVFAFGGKKLAIRHLLSHGSGGAATPGGKLNTLLRYMDAFEADIYWIGHLHDSVAKKVVRVGANANNTKLANVTKLGIISGSYFKTYAQGVTSYGERKGYRPTFLGPAKVTIRFHATSTSSVEADYFSEV